MTSTAPSSLTPANAARGPFDAVALVTSAGGLDALSAVLRDLPAPFPAAVLVAQHLSGQGNSLAGILRRCITLPVI